MNNFTVRSLFLMALCLLLVIPGSVFSQQDGICGKGVCVTHKNVRNAIGFLKKSGKGMEIYVFDQNFSLSQLNQYQNKLGALGGVASKLDINFTDKTSTAIQRYNITVTGRDSWEQKLKFKSRGNKLKVEVDRKNPNFHLQISGKVADGEVIKLRSKGSGLAKVAEGEVPLSWNLNMQVLVVLK